MPETKTHYCGGKILNKSFAGCLILIMMTIKLRNKTTQYRIAVDKKKKYCYHFTVHLIVATLESNRCDERRRGGY